MAATVLTLFDVDDTLAPGAGARDRCGRERKDGQPCRAWPMALGPACAHHILSDELAEVERLRVQPRAAA